MSITNRSSHYSGANNSNTQVSTNVIISSKTDCMTTYYLMPVRDDPHLARLHMTCTSFENDKKTDLVRNISSIFGISISIVCT